MRTIIFLVFGFCFLISGCSVHPIPKDVIGLSVYDLVHKIRCEASEFVIERYHKEFAAKLPGFNTLKGRIGAAQNQQKKTFDPILARLEHRRAELEQLGNRLTTEREELAHFLTRVVMAFRAKDKTRLQKRLAAIDDPPLQKKFNRLKTVDDRLDSVKQAILRYNSDKARYQSRLFRSRVRLAVLNKQMASKYGDIIKYRGHELAYLMKFDIVETNDAQVSSADYTWPISLGTVSLGVTAGDKKLREATREVRIGTDFTKLLGLKGKCSDAKGLDGKDGVAQWRYPISGRVGLNEVISEYLKIQGNAKLAKNVDAKPTLYGSQLLFTTTVGGSVKPSISITRASKRAFKGGSNFAGERKDEHELLVTLAPPSTTPNGNANDEQTVNVRILNPSVLDAVR